MAARLQSLCVKRLGCSCGLVRRTTLCATNSTLLLAPNQRLRGLIVEIGLTLEMHFDALRKETLATALTATRQNGPTALGLHTCAEAKLLFTSPLGRLISAFHNP